MEMKARFTVRQVYLYKELRKQHDDNLRKLEEAQDRLIDYELEKNVCAI